MRSPNEEMTFTAWLAQQGDPIHYAAGIPWTTYRGAITPASAGPVFVTPTANEIATLLRESGTWFARFCSDPVERESSWWYVMCDAYDPSKISANVRSKISRGRRRCTVRRLEPAWLAEHGYPCYLAAHARYSNARPGKREDFHRNALTAIGGPVEYWGVFCGEALAGYLQCLIDGNHVCTNVIKYDPAYLKDYSSYALISHVIQVYVVERGMVLNNSTRSISHDTNVQSFLLGMGFRRQFCRLNVVYHPWLGVVVRALYPTRELVRRLPNRGSTAALRTLLLQEGLSRAWPDAEPRKTSSTSVRGS